MNAKAVSRWTAVGVLLLAAGAAAQPAAPSAPALGPGRGQVTLSWDEFVKITGYDPAKKGSQVLTVPWSEVQKLLGDQAPKLKEGAGTVDLAWDQFVALMKWHWQQQQAPKAPAPPADFIITDSRYVGTVSGDHATFTRTVKLNILKKEGWKRIPVLANGVAPTKKVLPDGVFLNAVQTHYELLTETSGEMEVTIEFEAAVHTSAVTSMVEFPTVSLVPSVLELTIDRDDVDVTVGNAQSLTTATADGKTRVAAAVPMGRPISITWERALTKEADVAPRLYAETRTLVSVAQDLLLCREAVNYNILHAGVSDLRLAVPKGVAVLNVSGNNVQDWRVGDDGVLAVQIRGKAIGAYPLYISYEWAGQGAVQAPVILPQGVERQRGYVGVVSLANVELSAGAVTGATQIDVRQLPTDIPAMTNQPVLLGFRHVGDAPVIPLAIKKHEEVSVLATIVDAAAFTGMQLNDGRRMTRAVYSVRNNRNQFLRLKLPAGAEVWSVSVRSDPVSPAEDEQGNLLVPLVRSASQSRELAGFPVELVYVETPKQPAAAEGTLHVALPTCYVPVMHVMYGFYAPAEGEYTVGWGRSGFSGPLNVVKEFTALATGRGAAVVHADAAQATKQLAAQFEQRAQAAATARGATPIRVNLPVNGKLFRLEKILALPQDKLFFDVAYRRWGASK